MIISKDKSVNWDKNDKKDKKDKRDNWNTSDKKYNRDKRDKGVLIWHSMTIHHQNHMRSHDNIILLLNLLLLQ